MIGEHRLHNNGNRPRLLTALAMFCFAACAPASKDGEVSLGAPAQQTLVGKYAGTMPCADCRGIRTVLTLYSEPGPTRYELTETYVGTKDGDRLFPSSGRWTLLRGSATDVDAVVYQLAFDRPDRVVNYLKDGDDQLILLDRNQAIPNAANPNTLIRVPTEAVNPIVVTDTNANTPLLILRGQWVIFRLPSNPSTGFRWTLAKEPDAGLTMHGEPILVRGGAHGRLGAPGNEIWSLSATQSGGYALQFVYRRPWEPGSSAEKTLNFILQIAQ
jgi:copper homeostasis protein (lipoprotein)